MKILLVVSIQNALSDANYFITRSLIDGFYDEGHTIAVTLPKHIHFNKAKIYPVPLYTPKFLRLKNDSYEAYYKGLGLFDETVIQHDISALEFAYKDFMPDVILILDRPIANVLWQNIKTPIYTIVHSSILKQNHIDAFSMRPLNRALSHTGLCQCISLQHLFSKSHMLSIAPSLYPLKAQPLTLLKHFHPLLDIPYAKENITIFLEDKLSNNRLLRHIEDAFLGAPYPIYCYGGHSHNDSHENMTYLGSSDPSYIEHAKVVIHEGNPYFFACCLNLGIPQIILDNHSYVSHYYGHLVKRFMLGITIDKRKVNMARLYEAYQTILADDIYQRHIEQIKIVTASYPDVVTMFQSSIR